MKRLTTIVVVFVSMLLSGFAATTNSIDFADAKHVDDWFRHSVLGDVSFDSFEHNPANPIIVGKTPLEWPVNPFLFEDPVSTNWYLYVGTYARNYLVRDLKKFVASRCVLYRSRDRGQTWENLGGIFKDDLTMFDSDGVRQGCMPDVSVTYADGKYHLVYDWRSPTNGFRQTGIAHAVSDRPEGPFARDPKWIHEANQQPMLLGKYNRTYGGMIFRRKNDWLVLADMDGPSWALVGMTSSNAAGPYSAPKLLLTVESDTFHPPLVEFYPAFVQEGYIYMPATSVALNRDYQILFRVPLEDAMKPAAWEIVREGSVWHSDDLPNEFAGMWGQTYSGFVDSKGILQTTFPSLNKESFGTVNLAARPWDKPLRDHGFFFSGLKGPSLTFVRRSYEAFALETTLHTRGVMQIMWGYHAPLGPDRITADSSLDKRCLTAHDGLEITDKAWNVVSVDEKGARTVKGTGPLAPAKSRLIRIRRAADGQTEISLDDKKLWENKLEMHAGAIGLFAGGNTRVMAETFKITGAPQPLTIQLLPLEALLGAGVKFTEWAPQTNSVYHANVGSVHKGNGGRAKWNFRGTSFALWSPRGPELHQVNVLLDGKLIETLDLHAGELQPSSIVLKKDHLPDGPHALVLKSTNSPLVVDALEVTTGGE